MAGGSNSAGHHSAVNPVGVADGIEIVRVPAVSVFRHRKWRTGQVRSIWVLNRQGAASIGWWDGSVAVIVQKLADGANGAGLASPVLGFRRLRRKSEEEE